MYVTTLAPTIHQLKGGFHALAIVDRVAMNTPEQLPEEWEWKPSAGSYGRSFSLRTLHIDFLSSWTSTQPRGREWEYRSPHPCQHLLSAVFLIWAIATGVKWTVKVVLIYISTIAQDWQTFLTLLLRYFFWEPYTDPWPVFLICFLVIYIFWLLILLPDV